MSVYTVLPSVLTADSLKEVGRLIADIEDERDRLVSLCSFDPLDSDRLHGDPLVSVPPEQHTAWPFGKLQKLFLDKFAVSRVTCQVFLDKFALSKVTCQVFLDKENLLVCTGPLCNLSLSILSCRDPRGWGMPRGRPQASWLRPI